MGNYQLSTLTEGLCKAYMGTLGLLEGLCKAYMEEPTR